MNRYSAKLLFQFRVDDSTRSESRLCEERIITYSAASADAAMDVAKQKGADSVHDYLNDEGHTVFFEFVGVLDLLELGLESDPEDVWYDIVERELPLHVPEESEISAVRDGRPT